MSTNCDKCGVANPADIHTCGAKSDPYASEAETRALLVPDTRTEAEKHLDQLIQAESVAEMCGADYTQALRKAALKLAAEFDKRFTSMNGVDVSGRVSVPRDEWRALSAAIKQALAAPTAQEPAIEDKSQDWAGMDGATAWHLIDRHADGWADVAKMMGEWLAANTPTAAPVPLTDELWNLLDAVEKELNRRAIPEVWLLMAHKAGRAYIESRGITKGQPAPCTWTKSPDPHMPDTFDATCGVVWTFADGGPAENDVRFCPGCGGAVSVAEPEKGGAA